MTTSTMDLETTTNVGKVSPNTSQSPSPTHRLCIVPTCPLNELGVVHSTGIYHYNGIIQKQKPYFAFGNSNPHPLIHLAQRKQEEAMSKVARGSSPEINRVIALEMAGVVRRFCELHS